MSGRPADHHRNPLVRGVAFVLGVILLGFGVAGFFLPGLPGTPLLLVAAWLFSMSSDRLYRWMVTNRWFGQTIADYRAGLGIPRRMKRISVAAVVVAVSVSATVGLDVWWHRVLVVCVGLVGIWFIQSRPTTEDVIAARSR